MNKYYSYRWKRESVRSSTNCTLMEDLYSDIHFRNANDLHFNNNNLNFYNVLNEYNSLIYLKKRRIPLAIGGMPYNEEI
jgi:hypothetical protein